MANKIGIVVPASAGVIPMVQQLDKKLVGCTRKRGGDPIVDELLADLNGLYPQARG